MPAPSQNRHHLSAALQDHGQRDAATLVNLQIHPDTLTAEATIGDSISVDVDMVLGDPTAGAFNVLLPLGSEGIIGHVYNTTKLGSASEAFGMECQGDDEFANADTEYATETENATLGAFWDGTVWRKIAGASTGGPTDVTDITADTATIADELDVTDADIVGLEYSLQIPVTTLVGTGVYGVPVPHPGTITKIWSRLNAPLTTGNATLTAKIGATAVTTGVITITQGGSAIGDIDSCTPSAANVVAEGSNLSVTVGGTNDAAVGAMVTVVIRRSA